MTDYLRALRVEADEGNNDPGSPIRFKASTEGVKRDGLDLLAKDWVFDNVRANPTFLWSHGFTGHPAIGRLDSIGVEGEDTIIEVTFDQDDEFARLVESKYLNGYLNAVSMGWTNIDVEDKNGKPRRKRDVTEVSAVNVPADPDALMERQVDVLREEHIELTRILADFDAKRGKGHADTDPALTSLRRLPGAVGVNWRGVLVSMTDGLAAEVDGQLIKPHNRGISAILGDHERTIMGNRSEDFVYLRKAGENVIEGLLPHHAESGEAIVYYVIESMARLYCGLAGIPDAEFEGAYDHLARHYRQAKMTPPEVLDPARLRALSREDIANLFAGDQQRIVLDLPVNPEMLTDSEWAALVALSNELRSILSGRRKKTPRPKPSDEGELAQMLQRLDSTMDKLEKEVKEND